MPCEVGACAAGTRKTRGPQQAPWVPFQIFNLKSAVCKADQDSQKESCLALWTLLTPSGRGNFAFSKVCCFATEFDKLKNLANSPVLRPFEPGAELAAILLSSDEMFFAMCLGVGLRGGVWAPRPAGTRCRAACPQAAVRPPHPRRKGIRKDAFSLDRGEIRGRDRIRRHRPHRPRVR